MSTLAPLSSNSRGQLSSSPAGVTSWPLAADGAADCARNGTEQVMAATSATKVNEMKKFGVFMLYFVVFIHFPELTGSSLFCITSATRPPSVLAASKARLTQRFKAIRDGIGKPGWIFQKQSWASSVRHHVEHSAI